MTVHYPVKSLTELFLSDEYVSDKNNYKTTILPKVLLVQKFLNSIEINKQYYRTGILVKNPKYKKKVSGDTIILKDFKTSLNKLSSLNYEKITSVVVSQVKGKTHLYPLIIETIFEHVLLHHTYCKYYSHLVCSLHTEFQNITLIYNHIDKLYNELQTRTSQGVSEYLDLCSANKLLDQLIGYCMFISELELNQLIKDRVEPLINTLITELKKIADADADANEGEMYKCVLCLYTLCKQTYGSEPVPDNYAKDIIVLQTTRFMKIKFKLLDIMERR
jgi:hypothetical protein